MGIGKSGERASVRRLFILMLFSLIVSQSGHFGGTYLEAASPSSVEVTSAKFVHSVFFWMKRGAGEAEKQKLIADCKNYLGSVSTVRFLAVGIPAGTPREVVDSSYDVGLIIHFEDKDGHDYYQVAGEHQEFIERNSENWERVQVYDTVIQ